jgi:hypothetical protein
MILTIVEFAVFLLVLFFLPPVLMGGATLMRDIIHRYRIHADSHGEISAKGKW